MNQPDIHSTLNQVIEACPCTANLLTQLGVDPASLGDRSLEQVCAGEGIDPLLVLEVALTCDVALPDDEKTDWSNAPLDELTDYIVAAHHEYLRRELPRIRLLIDKAIHDHGDRHAELYKIKEVFSSFQAGLEQHLIREEQVLFPVIRELARAQTEDGKFSGPVDPAMADLKHDHDDMVHDLNVLRQDLTHGFDAPHDASTAYHALMEELTQLDANLQQHAYMENKVLFPRAIAAQHQATGL